MEKRTIELCKLSFIVAQAFRKGGGAAVGGGVVVRNAAWVYQSSTMPIMQCGANVVWLNVNLFMWSLGLREQ